MHASRTSQRCLSALAAVVLVILNCTTTPQSPAKVDYYVSVKGNDSTGNGTQSKPWRHIQYAINNAPQPGGGQVLRINMLKGIYEENLVIKHPLILKGAGVGPTSTWPNDPLVPVQEVSVIWRLNNNIPGILIQDATSVNLQDFVEYGGGIRVVNTRFTAYHIEVQEARGLYGIQIENSFIFYIENSKIMTGSLASDYGLDVMASDGDILTTYIGDNFDHAVNLSPLTLGDKFNPHNALPKMYVRIRDSEIAGSRIAYADGVRILGPMSMSIWNTKITRTHADNAPGSAENYNYPHAAIGMAGYQFAGSGLVEVDGATISGFDVGLAFDLEGYDLMVQNSNISGVRYDVHGMYADPHGAPDPIIDFGGGGRGSAGKNIFDAKPKYAFRQDAPYKVWACYNNWKVATSQIDPLRIFDKLDLPSKGRVQWDCSGEQAAGTVEQPLKVVTTTPSPAISSSTVLIKKDALCYEGPGPDYEVVSSVRAGQRLDLLGVGEGGGYFVVVNPVYHDPCWLPEDSAEYDGDPEQLPIIPRPLEPGATPSAFPGIMVP